MTLQAEPPMQTLLQVTAPIRRMLEDAAVGPLKAAAHVMNIQARWDTDFAPQADGVSFSAYIRGQFGKGCGPLYWARRAEAYAKFGPSNLIHHVAMVRCLSVPDKSIVTVLENLRAGARENGGVPMPPVAPAAAAA